MFEKQLRKSDILSKDASVFIGVFIVNFGQVIASWVKFKSLFSYSELSEVCGNYI